MRRSLVLALGFIALLPVTQARAQSESDKLRDALRNLTTQNNALDQERANLQKQLTQADQDKQKLQHEVDADKAEIEKLKKEQRDAVDQYNHRLSERDETIGKWKTAYEEAATVARTKDAERQKAVAEATAYKGSTQACQQKNVELVKVGRGLLHEYEKVTLGTAFVASEPFTGLDRARVQNLLQDYDEKIQDQKATP
jgi:chromosome segregation ATPase